MGRRIVCTDIHGCYNSFRALLEKQICLGTDDVLYFLGDAINKGPFSKEVLDYLITIRDRGIKLHLLRGNHEQELLKVQNGQTHLDTFISKGGQTLLRNFNIQHPNEVPARYIEFIRSFGYFLELPDFYLVHAGFNFDKVNPFIESEELLNIRDYKVDLEKTNNRWVIHGHSPTDLEQILITFEQKTSLHYSLDAGCAYHKNPRQAHLLALDLDRWKLYRQPNLDDSSNYDD